MIQWLTNLKRKQSHLAILLHLCPTHLATLTKTRPVAQRSPRWNFPTRTTDSDATATCRYVFKNLMRDWSQDGAPERTQSYGRICQEAQKQLAGRNPDDPAKILVPGMTHRLSSSLASLHTAG